MKADDLVEFLDELSRLMNYNMRQIIISSFFILMVSIIGSYTAYKISETVKTYRETNKRYSNLKMLNVAPGKNILLDSSNDNNEVVPETEDLAGENDEYAQITKTIKNKFTEYQNYNKSLSQHYSTMKNKAAPDVIDQTSMSVANDNW